MRYAVTLANVPFLKMNTATVNIELIPHTQCCCRRCSIATILDESMTENSPPTNALFTPIGVMFAKIYSTDELKHCFVFHYFGQTVARIKCLLKSAAVTVIYSKASMIRIFLHDFFINPPFITIIQRSRTLQ